MLYLNQREYKMLCSTIIPTIGRSTLSTAIKSVQDQGFEPNEHEIIVVNDSGRPLSNTDWQNLEFIKIINTNKRNRSVARNVGAAVSKGKFLHFLDDDDQMMPGAFDALLKVAKTSKAAWIHGAFRMVDNYGEVVTTLFPNELGNCCIQMMAWEWLPLQASLITSEAFYKVDGFASLPSLGGGFEDVHLARQISLFGNMACTEKIVATIRIGDASSTTNYVTMFDQNRHSREKTIDTPRALRRLIDSAVTSPSQPNYWFGKIIYYYMASIKWNLQNKHLFTAASRGNHMLASLVLAGTRLLSTDFWRGAIRPHYPRMGVAIQEAGADYLYAKSRQAMNRANTKAKGG